MLSCPLYRIRELFSVLSWAQAGDNVLPPESAHDAKKEKIFEKLDIRLLVIDIKIDYILLADN